MKVPHSSTLLPYPKSDIGGSSVSIFEKLLTKKQLSEKLSVSVSFIDKLMAVGGFPHVKIGRAVRFRESEVLVWLQRRRKP